MSVVCVSSDVAVWMTKKTIMPNTRDVPPPPTAAAITTTTTTTNTVFMMVKTDIRLATFRASLSGTFPQGRKGVVNQCLEFAD